MLTCRKKITGSICGWFFNFLPLFKNIQLHRCTYVESISTVFCGFVVISYKCIKKVLFLHSVHTYSVKKKFTRELLGEWMNTLSCSAV